MGLSNLKYIDEIIHILNGETKYVSDYLCDEMARYAADLKFEEAEQVKRCRLVVPHR